MTKFVLYARCSTQDQATNGHSIEAQRATATRYADATGGTIIGEYIDAGVSGKCDDRPELKKAINHARQAGAVLLVAKLDRLSRRVEFLFHLRDMLAAAGVRIVAADNPTVVSDTLSLGVFASLAQKERELISERTRNALALLKANGVRLGRPKGVDTSSARAVALERVKDNAQRAAEERAPVICAMYQAGLSLNEIARTLNAQGIPTTRRGHWTATAVKRVLARVSCDS